ncbi:MAG: hypothetical protein ACTSRG_13055 [Candidatus Helarchaeota archaeon]
MSSDIEKKYNPNYIGEPALFNGDLIKDVGDYKRNYGLDNAIEILIGTNKNYWGNLIEPEKSKVVGGLEDLNGIAINNSFLRRHNAKIKELLNPLIISKAVKSITVTSSNPSADKIEWIAELILSNGEKYYYSPNI